MQAGPSALYYRYQMVARGSNPFTVIVRNQIIRVSDHLHADEINFVEVSEQESAAAKARLDAHRKKRRDRHNKKK